MRIVIDMQGAQAVSPFHEICRFTMAFAHAVSRNRGEHEIILALNGSLPGTIEPIRTAFEGLLPQDNIRVWQAPAPVREEQSGNESRREAAELIREAFLVSLQPDVIHISSIFVGYMDDAVISIGRFDRITPVTVAIIESLTTSQKSSHAVWQNRKIRLLPEIAGGFISQGVSQEFLAKLPANNIIPIPIEPISNWDDLAVEAIKTWGKIAQTCDKPLSKHATKKRSRLAFVSPLPPERTGIADYSAELLPALAEFYDITAIVAQDKVTDPWVKKSLAIRDMAWFKANASEFDRVLYQIGNSPFHQNMLSLIREIPGTVVLHDFYLGHLMAWMEFGAGDSGALTNAMYISHGYGALRDCFLNTESAILKYPTNFPILQYAQGLIVHSAYSRTLAQKWYANDCAIKWEVIPHLRAPTGAANKQAARKQLGINENDYVVCSFGLLGPTKLNHRLLQAWLKSTLSGNKCCLLVFVGANDGGDYGAKMLTMIRASGCSDRIRLTGFASPKVFRQYLAAADVAAQLRTHSRGETSGTVLDCMNHALPLIVNANGSMQELGPETVWMLPDDFTDNDLVDALETLWHDHDRRLSLGTRAKEIIIARHAPASCARLYSAAIERFHRYAETSTPALIRAIAGQETFPTDNASVIRLSKAIAANLPLPKPAKQMFLDVSATCHKDLKTGIQRVVRSLVCELIAAPPKGYLIEPVYLSDRGGVEWHYRKAGKWTLETIGIETDLWTLDEPIEYSSGDLLLVVDFTGDYLLAGEASGYYNRLKDAGISIYFVVYDLLPILMPEVFPAGLFSYPEWINSVARIADGAICISQAVSEDLGLWMLRNYSERRRPLTIGWFHLGGDLQNSSPTLGIPENAEPFLEHLSVCPSFLMVGTIEPRKGYLQMILAFTQLWIEGFEINLVIVGKEGWKGLPDNIRRDIPDTVESLRNHPELNKRLFWLDDISDEYLNKVYAASTCLIAASYGEGFGLPLIEAAQHKLPIIARDIPVFREVAGEYAYYFDASSTEALAQAIKSWLTLYNAGQHPTSISMPWLTWKESAAMLTQNLIRTQSSISRVGVTGDAAD